jgi:hypothetical protein
LLHWLLCCCYVVVIVFVYFVAALPTPPPLPPGVEVDGDSAQDNHNGMGHYIFVWAIELSNGKNQEQ